ncbi:MAG: peptide ABC transporter substrate-binding protein [Verrucomicrobia bacterium]|nr:peptide ABC transporter substrate-binding protein [Verrucomicrobiota bacterium]
MSKIKSLSEYFLLTLLGMIILSGCSFQESAELVIINGAEPESLDPAIVTGQPDIRAASALFVGLTSPNPLTGLPEACLAESWEISPDAKAYTFHLRPEILWSTGEPITAQDFFYSWVRVLDPATASPYASVLFPVLNAEEFNAGKIKDVSLLGLKVLDSTTFQIQLRLPTAYFLDLCAMPILAVVPSFAIQLNPDQWIRSQSLPVSGPYMLGKWLLNDRIRLYKNPLYWDAAHTRCSIVDLLPIGSSVTAMNLYHQGKVDLLWDKELIPADLLDLMLERPDVHPFDYLGNYFVRINVTRSPFNDPKVRKAFSLAIDRNALVTRVTRAGETPSSHFTPDFCANYVPPDGLGYNPELARQLLAEAGYSNGEGFPPVTYLFNAAAGGSAKIHQKVAVELQRMWKNQLNVTVNLRQAEWKAFLSMVNNLDYDLCRASWVGDYNDATTFLNLFTSHSGNNRTGWHSQEYDTLLSRSDQELNIEKRALILKEAEFLLINEELPIIPLYFYKGILCFDTNKIEGIYPNPIDRHPINYIGKKR